MFHVGQKVVCIHSGPWLHIRSGQIIVHSVPKNDETVYVILGVYPLKPYPDTFGLRFNEFPGSDFDQRCFRPVVERKTDISIFKKMLTPELV